MAYSFLSFLRQGIANGIRNIADPSKGGAPVNTGAPRANIDVTVNVKYDDSAANEPLPKKNIELYGPGDVIGIDRSLIIRTDPQHYSTNFEPKHLAFIEFYDEDLPWRFSPTSVNDDNRKLSPWLTLIVLEELEFNDDPPSTATGQNQPLPSITLSDNADRAQVFSPFNNLWAWAHVHINEDVVKRDAAGGVLNDSTVTGNIRNVLDKDGDHCYSRLVCPRRLSANKAYHAFLIPSFETGRLSGLGKFINMKKVPLTQPAWGTYDQKQFPYYHRWYFRTGAMGDFEYLVDQLRPRAADARVGFRELYVDGFTENSQLKKLYLPGALRVPLETLDDAKKQEIENYENWEGATDPHAWQRAMANKMRLSLDDDEPTITMPVYGQWHANVEEILFKKGTNDLLPDTTRKNWVHELNLDPRYRIVAALGTKIVQQHQEEFMDAAWEQIQGIKEANDTIRYYQLAIEVNKAFKQNMLNNFSTEQLVGFTAPLHKKIRSGASATIFKGIDASPVPNAVSSNLLRKAAKTNGRISSVANNRTHVFANTGQDINAKFNFAKGQPEPAGLVNQRQFESTLTNYVTTHPVFIAARLTDRIKISTTLRESLSSDKNAIDRLQLSDTPFVPVGGNFSPLAIRQSGLPSVSGGTRILGKGTANTKMIYALQQEIKIEPKIALDINNARNSILAGVNAATNLKTRFVKQYPNLSTLIPAGAALPAQIMQHPQFDLPMYLPLNELSNEYFLPNINLVEHNSITFLESNQRFIEAYMVGVNHEMGRELLWRGYPTDQRGSYFRNFWDSMSGAYQGINEIHTWDKKLGENSSTGNAGMLFLVVRGDLLNKYPNTVVSAQRADWGTVNGSKTVNTDRIIKPGSTPVLPVFEAKVEPDIYFLAFKIVENGKVISEKDLSGTPNPTSTTDDPGWFFVFQERPGEPRFGLDLNTTAVKKKWSDIAWTDTGVAEHSILNFQKSITVASDIQAVWPPQDAAQLAYILYQQPVLVAIHASRLLNKKM
jgi:hypothetical protein